MNEWIMNDRLIHSVADQRELVEDKSTNCVRSARNKIDLWNQYPFKFTQRFFVARQANFDQLEAKIARSSERDPQHSSIVPTNEGTNSSSSYESNKQKLELECNKKFSILYECMGVKVCFFFFFFFFGVRMWAFLLVVVWLACSSFVSGPACRIERRPFLWSLIPCLCFNSSRRHITHFGPWPAQYSVWEWSSDDTTQWMLKIQHVH